MRQVFSKLRIAAVGALSLLIMSCGGGGGGGSTGGGATNIESGLGTGSVTLLATDAPTEEFKEINLSIVKAELLSDSGRVTVFSGEKEFDLLQLTEVTKVFSVSEVPEGSYNKIRLTLTQIELVFHDDRDPAYPKLPGNGKLDLNPRETFHVDSDVPLAIQLDFDAKKSIHVVQAGNKEKYNFRPVVFVKIVEGEFDTKLIRQRGTINELDLAEGEFKLCLIEAEIQPISDDVDDLPDCVWVDTNSASIFDDLADPVELGDFEVSEIVTVVGRFRFHGDDDSSEGDDDSTDDAADRRRLVLIAEVIWSGNDIMQSDNIACSGVTNDTDRGNLYENVELPLLGDMECTDVDSRPTILRPGARIYDSEGNRLSTSSISKGILNQVDAYTDAGTSPEVLKAVLVMLKMGDDSESPAQLAGTIGGIEPGESLVLITDTGDRCVDFSEGDTEVFEISQDEEGNVFSRMTVSALMSGQIANAFGKEESEGCLKAHTIIYEEDEATIQPI
jgi:hypothetical protein